VERPFVRGVAALLVNGVTALLVNGVTALCACGGGTTALATAPELAAATGSVQAKRDGAELALDIRVEQLAPAGKVTKGATGYAVWAKPTRGGPARMLGALKVDNNRGELRAKTADEDISLIITAEPTFATSEPRGATLLWAYIDGAEGPRSDRDAAAGGEPRADAASQAEPADAAAQAAACPAPMPEAEPRAPEPNAASRFRE
jgi:hypothetical protein